MLYNGLDLTANNYYAQKMYPDVTRSVEPFFLATLVDLLYTQFQEKISDAIHAQTGMISTHMRTTHKFNLRTTLKSWDAFVLLLFKSNELHN